MSREGKKLQHIHSSVPNKQPKPSILEVGEYKVKGLFHSFQLFPYVRCGIARKVPSEKQ